VKWSISLGVCDCFIRCVLTILLGVLYCGCFNFICFVICVCVFIICIYLHFLCSVCVLIFIVLCIFIFVCTSVGLLPPGKSPIAVSSSSKIFKTEHCGFC
jgi:hypothetical protein